MIHPQTFFHFEQRTSVCTDLKTLPWFLRYNAMHMHDHNCTAHQLRSDVKDACACQFVWQNPLAFSRSLSPRILMPSCDGCPCYMEHRAGAYVSISTFPALFSLPPTDDEMMTQRFRNTYRVLGTLMSFLPREGCDQRHIGVPTLPS